MPKSDQGVNVQKYMVVPRTLIFLTSGDKVLLLKGAATKRLWANLYNGVGGHIERGEDVITSARRELLEETGLTALNLRICGVVMVDASDSTGVGIYILRGEPVSMQMIESDEGSLEWIPLSETPTLPLVEDLKTILPVVLSMKPGDPPFSAVYTYDLQDHLQIRFGY